MVTAIGKTDSFGQSPNITSGSLCTKVPEVPEESILAAWIERAAMMISFRDELAVRLSH